MNEQFNYSVYTPEVMLLSLLTSCFGGLLLLFGHDRCRADTIYIVFLYGNFHCCQAFFIRSSLINIDTANELYTIYYVF